MSTEKLFTVRVVGMNFEAITVAEAAYERMCKRDQVACEEAISYNERRNARHEYLKTAWLRNVKTLPFSVAPDFPLMCAYVEEVRDLFTVAADHDHFLGGKQENGFDKVFATLLLCAKKGDVDAVSCLEFLADSFADQFDTDEE